MHRYQIRVELDERFEPDDVRLDLRTNELHPLHKHDLHIAVSNCGGAVLGLSFTAVDLWSAILTTMALVRQSGSCQPQSRPASRLGCSILMISATLRWPGDPCPDCRRRGDDPGRRSHHPGHAA
jgi:hypothetical protein